MPDNNKEPIFDIPVPDPRLHSNRYSENAILSIVVEANHLSTRRIAIKYGIHPDEINKWREEIDNDPRLKQVYVAKMEKYVYDFSEDIARTIKAQLDFLLRAAQEADPTDRGMIRAVAGALKMAGEFGVALDLTRAHLNQTRGLGAGDQSVSYMLVEGEDTVEADFAEVEEIT